MIKPAPCFKRASMIDCYRVAISYVSGSLQIRRVLHEFITLSSLDRITIEARTLCCESEVSVENCVVSF